ncbi:hypothetical protein HaLaN_26971, partial [Haematococcus lacustris]
MDRVRGAWVLSLVQHSESERAWNDMHIRRKHSHQQGQYALESAACGRKELYYLAPTAQQLAPLALDLVWGMEGMLQVRGKVRCGSSRVRVLQPACPIACPLSFSYGQLVGMLPDSLLHALLPARPPNCQMMQQHERMFSAMACVGKSSGMCSLFRSCCVSMILFGHVIEVLAEPAAVGPAGLAAQPASWLPCGNSLVEGWCSQLLARVCQLFCNNSPDLEGPPDHTRIEECQALADGHTILLRVQVQAPPSMSPEAERLLACLTLVLTVALPLDTWLAVAPSLPAARASLSEQASAIHDLLTRVEPEQGAANKLQLLHLVAPAPQGWQPGRLTVDRGRGPPELIILMQGLPSFDSSEVRQWLADMLHGHSGGSRARGVSQAFVVTK